MQGKIVLAGGGNEKDSYPVDKTFTSWIEPNAKILYLPVALRGVRPFTECLNWITSTFLPFNITQIEMWTDLSEHQDDELSEFASVYIGGGNTYLLLAEFLECGFDQHLIEYVSQGGIIYGGSAGAAILGKDIRTISHIDRNEIGLTETKGLDLVKGYSVWVHYQNPSDDGLIYEFQDKYNQPVLAISERAGIALESSEVKSVGFDSAFLFDKHGKQQL
jgi:dipeptidase E